MANVYLYQPGDIDAPQWSTEEIERIYGPTNLYSFDSTEFWAGFGGFGESITYKFKGYGMSQGSGAGALTEVAAYYWGKPVFSIDDFSVPISRIGNYTPGEPLAQVGIFDGPDFMIGSDGNDTLAGYRGLDELSGMAGNDIIRAGNGPDVIWGGPGSDTLYGGFGRNTFKWENDGAVDYLYVKSDQFAYNYLYGKAGNSPNGEKADTIYALDAFDQIYIQGVSTESLSFSSVSGGIGIFANGYLEATYIGQDLTIDQLSGMTSGVLA